jgi:PAS domain S-box-containing protein
MPEFETIPPKQKDRMDANFALEAAGFGVWEMDPDTNLIHWDNRCAEIFGLKESESLPFLHFQNYIHPADLDKLASSVKSALDINLREKFDTTCRIIEAINGEIRHVRFIGSSLFDDCDKVIRFGGILHDVTKDILRQQEPRTSNAPYRSMIEEAPVATGLFVGRDLRIEVANDVMIKFWGKGSGVLGLPLAEALPELKGQPFLEILDRIFTTGVAYEAKGVFCELVVNGILGTYYFDFSYKPLFDENGDVYAIMDMAIDVTEEVIAAQQLETSEARFRSIFEQAPLAIALLKGPEMRIEACNDLLFKLWRRDSSVTGLPIIEALPEIKDQGFIALLNDVYQTGKPFQGHAVLARLERQGIIEDAFFDFTYAPLRDNAGAITGVMILATEVTMQVMARKELEAVQDNLLQSNQRLSLALEAGHLGSYEIDLSTGVTISTAQCKANYGRPANLPFNFQDLMEAIVPEDRNLVNDAVAQAVATKSTYYATYRVHWPDGSLHWVNASGHLVEAPEGGPPRVIGVTQDITLEKMAQQELERQVRERTFQLQDSILDLKRSNQNLQQFAYIASHDLQEPLRKIQSFGDLLKNRYSKELGEGVNYLLRMQKSAGRMSVLIQDLLNFSRISTRQEASTPVHLGDVVKAVKKDLDLMITESGAQIVSENLPTVSGDKTQLNQLFQNLLSNAVKFRRADTSPLISVNSQIIPFDELPAKVKPARISEAYYRIDVSDNGIGFDELYLDRIFQVFQRLHGISEYPGTGIGLAICEKVAANHGGAITARSIPMSGSTFSLYIPVNT